MNVRVNKWQNCLYSKSTQKDEDTRTHGKCIQPKCTCKQTRCSMVYFRECSLFFSSLLCPLFCLALFLSSFPSLIHPFIRTHARTHAPSFTARLNIIFLHIAFWFTIFLSKKESFFVLIQSHSLAHFSFLFLLFFSSPLYVGCSTFSLMVSK